MLFEHPALNLRMFVTAVMYDYIKGEITELTPVYTVVEAAGVGYHIVISLNTYSILEKQKEAKVYVHYTVREDAQILYGFAEKQEREVFRMLIGVSGVGGNTARAILSTFRPEELAGIISTENAALLKSVKGLGIKTAQKIIVDLRDKIAGVTAVSVGAGITAPGGRNYDEAIAALSMLGFPKAASDKAVRRVMKEDPSLAVEDIVRKALKAL